MSLYSYNFELLPKPPRSPLSWGDESTRAVLPDFDSVQDLNTFLYHLFTYRFGQNVFLQIKIGIALLTTILLISAVIIARRMYERNFWIIRIIRVPSGPIIVPNPILSFGFIESGFVIVFVGFLITTLLYQEYHTLRPTNMILWILLPWCITIFGAILATVGTHYATPTRQIHIPSTRKEKISVVIGNWLNNAWVINCMAIALPAFICITIAVPTFIGNYRFMQGQHQYENEWLENYSNESEFSQVMIIEAQEIWFKVLHGTQIASSVFCLWFAWATICFILHSFFTLRLLRLVKEELGSSDKCAPKFVVTTTRMVTMLPTQALATNTSAESESYTPQGRRRSEMNRSYFGQRRFDAEPYLIPIPSTNTFVQEQQQEQQDLDQDQNKTVEMPEEDILKDTLQTEGKLKKTLRSFLPNIILSAEKHEEQVAKSMLSSRDEQKRELQKAAVYILIQYLIIGPGCASFGGIALMMAFTLNGSFAQPSKDGLGTLFERFGAVALLSVTYVVIGFGSVCAGAIFHRTYEPVFVNYSVTATISSFGFNSTVGGNQQQDNKSSMNIINSSKLKKFVLVGGTDSKIQNKLRYPQAMVGNLFNGRKNGGKMTKNSIKTVAEEISYNSSILPESNEIEEYNRFKYLHQIRFLPKTGNAAVQPHSRRWPEHENRQRQIEFWEAEPQEGQLVNHSVVLNLRRN